MRHPSVGDTFVGQYGNCYVVSNRIGQGGTASVYEVVAVDGSRWAAKLLSDHRFPVDDGMRARFIRECEQLARIDHPRVLRFHDRATFAGEPVLILELAERSLHDHLEGWAGTPPLPVALAWLEQAFDGVAELHRLGIVHRDLSPKNLMLRPDGSLAVGDFGTVRHRDDVTITQERAGLGSLIYISAQQFDDAHQAGPRDDVFSLGQIAWQLLSGRRPIGNVPAIGVVRPSLPVGLAELIERARCDDHAVRPPDAGAALSELREILSADREPRLLIGGSPEQAAAIRAIRDRQQNHLAGSAQDEELRVPAQALERLVDALGPIRLEPSGFTNPAKVDQMLPLALSDELHSVFTRGSLRLVYDVVTHEGGDGWLLQLVNAITGRSAEVAHSGLISSPGQNLDDALADLELLTRLEAPARDRLVAPLTAPAFVVGGACAECGEPLRLHRRHATGRFSGPGLFRAATCVQDDPPEPYRCCICGERFRPIRDSDEWGDYDAAGCACGRSLPVEFGDHPWREGRLLTVEEVAEVFG